MKGSFFRSFFITATVFTGSFLFPQDASAVVLPITFPVNGPSSFRNDFSEPRGGGTREHLGIDIIADKMTPVVSAVDGRVVYIVSPQASWGYSISIQDSQGNSYRYLHLNNDTPGTDDGNGGTANAYAAGIQRGASVAKGQIVGWVGDSGNAENTVSHLHFEIRQAGSRAAINPYDSLSEAARQSPFSASIRVGSAQTISHASEEGTLVNDLQYFFAEDLSIGSTGIAVRQLQTKLKTLGYFTSSVTEYFGTITQAAVIKYQQAKGISATGFVGVETRRFLNEGIPVPTQPMATGPKDTFTQNLSVGSTGEEVRQLQLKLKTLGYFLGDVTTYFGPITKAAVMKFQTANKITPTGVVELVTRGYLNGCTSPNGFSSLTGKSCSNLLPIGCTSNSGFSSATGYSCGTVLLPGCTSHTGYSSINGAACWNI